MKDRTPKYPGRVKLVPVDGQDNVFDMTRADEATEDGTPYAKLTILTDETAALFGLSDEAVPNAVLAFLGKYNQHWWRRTALVPVLVGVTIPVEDYEYVGLWYENGASNASVYAADEYTINQETGEVTLVNPETVSLYSDAGDCENKWLLPASGVTFYSQKSTTSVASDAVEISSPILWPGSTASNSYGRFTKNTVYTLDTTTELQPGEVDYVRSNDRTNYPHTGDDEYFKYEYLGVPFENAVTVPKIATGSYDGTDTYGADNPNSLTFDFAPKLLRVVARWTKESHVGIDRFDDNDAAVLCDWLPTASYQYGAGVGTALTYGKKSDDGKTIYWYSTTSATVQLNSAGYTYYWIAIG